MEPTSLLPRSFDLLTDVDLLRTLRGYERTRATLAARQSPTLDRLHCEITEAIAVLAAELARRGRHGALRT